MESRSKVDGSEYRDVIDILGTGGKSLLPHLYICRWVLYTLWRINKRANFRDAETETSGPAIPIYRANIWFLLLPIGQQIWSLDMGNWDMYLIPDATIPPYVQISSLCPATVPTNISSFRKNLVNWNRISVPPLEQFEIRLLQETGNRGFVWFSDTFCP